MFHTTHSGTICQCKDDSRCMAVGYYGKRHGGPVLSLPKQGVSDALGTYVYDDLDRLIRVTQGVTTTLYGYTGDGDRLWQNTEGVTTTFTLDLNGALAQVLAQTQGGQQTAFLPGIGQESNGTWTYFHTDALGSVRHLSGNLGGVLGDIDYSPFGEIVNSTGLASWYGFTGEEQDGSNGLTYLRARYYNPALGRFLTPDSIIPDITNGQSLNAYAYVYNDPINLVDPSGNMPDVGNAIVNVAKHLPSSWQSKIKSGAQRGLSGINSWYSVPSDCSCQSGGLGFPGLGPSDVANPLALTTQAVWGVASEPAQIIGETITTNARRMDVKLLPNGNVQVPSFGTITKASRSAPLGSGSDLFGWKGKRLPFSQSNTTYFQRSSGDIKVTRITGANWNWSGAGGVFRTVGFGTLTEGVFQLYSDLDLCLSNAQRFNRFALALALGIPGALAGAFAFGLATAFGAPVLLTIGASIATGIIVGAVTNAVKTNTFKAHPKVFGG